MLMEQHAARTHLQPGVQRAQRRHEHVAQTPAHAGGGAAGFMALHCTKPQASAAAQQAGRCRAKPVASRMVTRADDQQLLTPTTAGTYVSWRAVQVAASCRISSKLPLSVASSIASSRVGGGGWLSTGRGASEEAW